MKALLDQNGNPISKEILTGIYNRGPFWMAGGLFSTMLDGTYLNPDKIGISEYKKMEMDDAVSSALLFVTLSSLARIGEYTHPNEIIQDFIRKEFQNIRGSIYDLAEEMLYTALQMGFSCGELCYTIDNQVHLSDIQFLDPEYITFELYQDSPLKNRIKAIKQYGSVLGNLNTLGNPPIEKFIHLALNTRFMNPYGRSRLQAAYPLWYFKLKMLTAWGITGEKHGTPSRICTVSKDAPAFIRLENGEEVDLYTFLERSLSSWTNVTDIILPPGVDLASENSKGDIGKFFIDAVQYADKSIYRALLLPGLVASSADYGSRALGSTHFKLFDLAVQNNQRTIINSLLDQPIRRLIILNFGPQETYGDFQVDELDPTTAKMMMEIFSSAIDKGVLNMGQLNDLRHARKAIGAPDISDEEFKQEQAEKAAKDVELQNRLDETRQKLQQPKLEPQQTSPPIRESFSRLNGIESYFIEV